MRIHKQRGMSLVGFIIVLGLSIFVAYLGMRIIPIYMEYYAVVSAMNGVAAEEGSAHLTPYQIRTRVMNRLYVSYSQNVKDHHIKISRSTGVQLRIVYEVRKPVIGNLDVVAHFDKSVRLAN